MMEGDETAVRLREVSVSFAGRVAVDAVSLDLPRRGVSVFIGRSGSGKTTLLRDMVRQLSDGLAGIAPLNVGVADERMELGAVCGGTAQLDLGSRTDIISACDKARAVEILLRSMGPQLVVTDEIGSAADTQALLNALNAGVGVLASAHAANYDELSARPHLSGLVTSGFFERIIFPVRRGEGLCPGAVYDGQGVRLI